MTGEVLSAKTFAPRKLSGLPRVDFLLKEVTAFILLPEWGSAVVVREDYAFAAHGGSDAALKELGAALEYHLWERNIRLFRVGIAQIKKYVTGKGTSEKDRMMLSIYKDFHYEPADEHEADAVGVALTARGIMSGAATTAPQREVIASAHKNGHPLTEVGK